VRQHQRPKQIAPILKAGVKIGFDHQHHLHSALVLFAIRNKFIDGLPP
jgi:hypothetical protein